MIERNRSWKHISTNGNGHSYNSSAAHDEIDLLDLLSRMIRFVTNHKTALLVAPVVGIILGALYFFIVNPLYKSELVFEVSVLKKNELEQMIGQLNRYLTNEDVDVLENFDADPRILKEMVLQEKEENSSSFTLSVVVTDPAHLPVVQQSLISYINNNEYTRREILAEKNMINKTLMALNEEEAKVDAVLNSISKAEEFSSENIADMFALKIDIQKEKIQLEKKLSSLRSVTIVQGFPSYNYPYNKNLLLILGISTLIVTFLTLFFLLGREIYRLSQQPRSINFPFSFEN